MGTGVKTITYRHLLVLRPNYLLKKQLQIINYGKIYWCIFFIEHLTHCPLVLLIFKILLGRNFHRSCVLTSILMDKAWIQKILFWTALSSPYTRLYSHSSMHHFQTSAHPLNPAQWSPSNISAPVRNLVEMFLNFTFILFWQPLKLVSTSLV
jgi:hypothetical protein